MPSPDTPECKANSSPKPSEDNSPSNRKHSQGACSPLELTEIDLAFLGRNAISGSERMEAAGSREVQEVEEYTIESSNLCRSTLARLMEPFRGEQSPKMQKALDHLTLQMVAAFNISVQLNEHCREAVEKHTAAGQAQGADAASLADWSHERAGVVELMDCMLAGIGKTICSFPLSERPDLAKSQTLLLVFCEQVLFKLEALVVAPIRDVTRYPPS